MRRLFAATLILALGALGPATGPAAKTAIEGKLLGGMDRLLEVGYQPDQRLDYLVQGFRRGDYVAWVMLDGRAAGRVRDIEREGARVRWTFRSINAVTVVARRDAILRLAAKPWVRYLYPVGSGKASQVPTISGTITRGDPPAVHEITVPSGSSSITVDLTVLPPGPPHFDINVVDFLEARLVDPAGRVVMVRPNLLHKISFRYGEPDALDQGMWRLEIWYRSANIPIVPLVFAYAGDVVTSGDGITRDGPAPIPTGSCTSKPDIERWKNHPNLKRRSVTDIGAPVLWDAGIRGRGVRLAVLDTGIDVTHPDLDDQDWEHWGDQSCPEKIIADALFTGGLVLPGQGTWDVGTHGTHVAGEAAGTAEGATADEKGAYPGVAPEASLIAGRIAIDVTALTDDMLAAAEWAVIDQQADVVNLSFGIDVRYGVLTDQFDPQAAGFEALALNPAWGYPSIMTSAGNSGDRFSTIGVPAAAPHMNAIAATVKDWDAGLGEGQETESGGTSARGVKDKLGLIHPSVAEFSSRGPTQDLYFGPDLSAPGASIVAAYSNQNTDGEMDGYASFSGTSMASPHAAGSAALLVDAYRQRFGAAGPFGNRPPFWVVAAALGNTAGSAATRPSFGATSLGKRVSYAGVGADGLFQLFGADSSRENQKEGAIPVGSLVEGAGRVNIPAAWSALTQGVLIHTVASNPASPAFYDLQASIQGNTVKPQESLSRTLHLRPATSHPYVVTFSAASGVPSVNARAIPPSWWTLPPATSLAGLAGKDVEARITVPAGSAPGLYTGYLLARAQDTVTGRVWLLRVPALVVVEVIDSAAGEGDGARAEIDGFGYAVTDTTFVTNVVLSDSVNNDWSTYAIEIPKGLERLDLSVRGINGNDDEWDLFVYDDRGLVLADTFEALPADDPSLSVSGLEAGRYRVVVSLTDTSPESRNTTDPRGVPFALTVDLVGAASPAATVAGTKTTRPPAKPAPRGDTGTLPATGIPGVPLQMLGVGAIAAAALIGTRRRR